jgi:hypothetical protein
LAIRKEYQEYFLHCDVCEEETAGPFDDFYEAVDSRKELGWCSRKDSKGNWYDQCPICRKRGDKL